MSGGAPVDIRKKLPGKLKLIQQLIQLLYDVMKWWMKLQFRANFIQ